MYSISHKLIDLDLILIYLLEVKLIKNFVYEI